MCKESIDPKDTTTDHHQPNNFDLLLEVDPKMGNVVSGSSRSHNPATRYLDNLRLPLEIQLMIAAELCPHCSIEEDEFPTTEDARELQRSLGNLAATCKHLQDVANQHRYHSFVMPYDPQFMQRQSWSNVDGEIAWAHDFKNSALPELLDQMISNGQQGQHLRYLSIRNFTLQFKAGVTKRRLRLFMAASLNLGIPVPSFVPALLTLPDQTRASLTGDPNHAYWVEGQLWLTIGSSFRSHCTEFDVWLIRLLLFGSTPRLEKLMMDPIIAQRVFASQPAATATLPSVTALGIPEARGDHRWAPPFSNVPMEKLLLSFPNLLAFHNDEIDLALKSFTRVPANGPPFYPNIRKLILTAEQPGRLHHLTQVLKEFPNLEELYYHRRTCGLVGERGPNFSNANMFNGVHHCLRKLTYFSVIVFQDPSYEDYYVEVRCYQERRLSDVPHFAAFAVLEELNVDQGLLGRLGTVRDRVESPTGPYFADLDWLLPQSLRRLTVNYVYDWPELASQLITLAVAKRRGEFPLLSEVYVVIVRSCTVVYGGSWPPRFPLLPSHDVTRHAGELMREAGIYLDVRSAELEPPPVQVQSEQYPHDAVPAGTLIAIDVQGRYFNRV